MSIVSIRQASSTKTDGRLETFIRRWLSGTTCHRHGSLWWGSECGNYVIMKHHGHTDYVDRVTGSAWCGTYYALYDIRNPLTDRLGGGYLKKWEGRWRKQYLLEALPLCR